MKTITPSLLLLSLAIVAADGRAGPDPRQGYDTHAGAAPSGSASALPPEPEPVIVDGHKPWVPALDVAFPPGASASDPPSREEWASAAEATEVRVTDPGCKAQRVREWYRITCGGAQAIELISGGREAVTFDCKRPARGETFCEESWVVFPARRGDRRAFEVFGFGKWGPEPDAIVTEQLLDGDPVPLVTVSGLHWGF